MVSKNFIIQEFVPPSIYERFGESSIWFIDQRIILLAQFFRDMYGPITINNWHTGGIYDSRGFRPPNDPDGGFLSQHKFGRAVDLGFRNAPAEVVRNYIRKDFIRLNKEFGLTTIEEGTPTWVHLDLRHTGLDHLMEVPYK